MSLFQFAGQVIRGRWLMVFASLLIMAGAGATYIFGHYSSVIKETLGYDEAAINQISFYRDVGANFAIFSGLIGEVIPTWLMLLIGAAMNFGGYYMIWLAVMGKIARPQVWQMCLYMAIGTNSQNFTNTATLVTCVKNFPESRGVVLGLMKGLVGLSGAIITQIYLGIYGDDLKSLILMIGWLPALVSVMFMFIIRPMKIERQPNELRTFLHFFYTSILLAIFLMIMTLLEKYTTVEKTSLRLSATIVSILVFLPLAIVVREEAALWKLKKQLGNPPAEAVTNEKPQAPTSPVNRSCFANIFDKPARGEDHTILQAILSVDMLYIFIISLCGYGTSLTAMDQLRKIGTAQEYNPRLVSSIITLVSIWNYYGRVYSGFVSEFLLKKWKVGRSIMMTIVLVMSGIGMFFVAFPVIPGSFYVASVIIGFSFGAQVPLNLAMISEFFGLKYYSTLFNCAQLMSPLGAHILNGKITKNLYEKEAMKGLEGSGLDMPAVNELTCVGSHCYRLSFSILGLVLFFAAIVSFHLAKRTKEFYRGDIYKKFRSTGRYSRSETYKRYKGETYVQFTEDNKVSEMSEIPQPCR